MRRAVFLDRDGVINKAFVRNGVPHPPSSVKEVEILPGVLEALCELRAANYLLVVITNQPDVARGIISRANVESINKYLASRLPLDVFRTCFHDSKDSCSCRKPMPGSIYSAAVEYEIDLSKSFMIGDRWRDIDAGIAAGCTTFFINYGYDEKITNAPDFIVSSLSEVKNIILREF